MEKESTTESIVRVGVVTTDSLRLVGLQAVLADCAEFEIVPLSMPRALDTSSLEVVLIDSAATTHLFELLAAFQRDRPKLRLVVMGAEQDFDYIERVIGAGAKGYLNQTVSEVELKMALHVVRDGSVWAPRKVLAKLLDRAREGVSGDAAPKFTRREKQVLALLAQGQPNREIALALGVDEGSIKAHVGRLMRKMGVENRTALTMRTIEWELV